MSVVEMRKQVKWVYSGSYSNTPWNKKVDKMTDNQVISIFYSLKGKGKLK